MVVKLNRPDIRYEVESLIRMLLGETPVTIVLPGEAIPDDNDSIAITVQEQEKCCLCHVVACLNGEKREASSPSTVDRTEIEQTICRMLYNQLTALLGHTLPWGMLTGVRPVKLVRQMTEVGMTEADVMQKLSDYGVSEERAQLSMDTWHNQREIVRQFLRIRSVCMLRSRFVPPGAAIAPLCRIPLNGQEICWKSICRCCYGNWN